MKIITTVTEIECNAEELRQSTSLSDGLYNAMRRAFNGPIMRPIMNYQNDDEEEEEE